MNRDALINTIKLTKHFFDTSTSKLDEADSGFAPKPDMFSVAQHVAHTAQTIDWFLDGAFGAGFDMDFAKHETRVRACTSLQAARKWHEDSTNRLLKKLAETGEDEWSKPIQGQVMSGAPRFSIIGGIHEHTSHHRGALAVYQRLLDKVPVMPYM